MHVRCVWRKIFTELLKLELTPHKKHKQSKRNLPNEYGTFASVTTKGNQ